MRGKSFHYINKDSSHQKRKSQQDLEVEAADLVAVAEVEVVEEELQQVLEVDEVVHAEHKEVDSDELDALQK